MTATPSTPPRHPKSLRAKLGLAVGAVLLTVLGLEVGFRIAGIDGQYYAPRVDQVQPGPDDSLEAIPHGFIPGATLTSKYDTDPRGTFGPDATVAHTFNSAGWRDQEHSERKPRNVFRILGLGDSYLFGQGIRQEDICLNVLGETLQEDDTRTIECINTGVSGFNTSNQRDLLMARGFGYDPDLVVVFFVLNDVESNRNRSARRVEFFRDYTTIYQQKDTLSHYSNLWSWARQRVILAMRASEYTQECVAGFAQDSGKWQQCRSALANIWWECKQRNVGMLVAIFPFFVDLDGDYPFQEIHDRVRLFCEETGIDVIDLRNAYRDYNGPELWVHPTDQHPNEKAHEIAAEAIAEYLRRPDVDLLKRPRRPTTKTEGPTTDSPSVRRTPAQGLL